MPQTDYAALAEQARQQAPPQMDYAALAEQARKAPPAATGPAPRQYQNSAEMMGDIGIGALKQTGRIIQSVPGFARGTDRMFGLPEGASAQAMQPTNTAQKVGGYAADAAEMVAGGAAENPFAGGPVAQVARNAQGRFVRPAARTVAGVVRRPLDDATIGAMNAIRAELGGAGPITVKRAAELATKYGIKATKYALLGMGATGMWRYLEHK